MGTDIGALYLTQHSEILRLTLILQECSLHEQAAISGRILPNSVAYSLDQLRTSSLEVSEALTVAQVARAYLLGFEVGVRLSFQREPAARKSGICTEATQALGQ
jgi:hypothetical protein